ncbi:MAG TPA: acyl carrier protein [Candidatus Paceibacterota bacterium]
MINYELNRSDLENILGLSCIENYFLYALKKHTEKYSLIFLQSYLSFEEIIEEFCINKAEYAYFYKIPRLQTIAENYSIIKFKHQNISDFFLMVDEYNFICIAVNPEYIEQKYKTNLWRNDHYILLSKKDDSNFYYLNDSPRDNGIINIRDVRKIYNNEVIGFSYIDCFSNVQQQDFLEVFYKSLFISQKNRFDYLDNEHIDFNAARDIFGILRISRKRMKAFCDNYINANFMNDYISNIDKIYTSLEYMRLRKKIDLLKVDEFFHEIYKKDNEIIEKLKYNLKEIIMEEIAKKTVNVICEFAVIKDDVTFSEKLSNLGIDSLKMVELIVALEDKFSIQFDDSKLDPIQLSTVEDIVDLVKSSYLFE